MLARLLNSHPQIVTVIDNSMYESWGLYYYRSRLGLIQQLRTSTISPEQARQHLYRHIVRDDQVWGVAPSSETTAYPLVPEPTRPDEVSSAMWKAKRRVKGVARRLFPARQGGGERQGLTRHRLPLELFQGNLSLCLKSPEIVFFLPQLAIIFSTVRFVLVHRPVIEIAESMYRKGVEWRLASYHRRWRQEVDGRGDLLAPPGVPGEWHELWKTVSDFQRCVIYATSYLRAMALGLQGLSLDRFFLYNHTELCLDPLTVVGQLGEFLCVNSNGFQEGIRVIRKDLPKIAQDLQSEYDEIKAGLSIQDWMMHIASLSTK